MEGLIVQEKNLEGMRRMKRGASEEERVLWGRGKRSRRSEKRRLSREVLGNYLSETQCPKNSQSGIGHGRFTQTTPKMLTPSSGRRELPTGREPDGMGQKGSLKGTHSNLSDISSITTSGSAAGSFFHLPFKTRKKVSYRSRGI